MNARDRIIEALAEAEAQPAINIPDLADAVLAVLPDLLTDSDVITTAAEATDTAHVRTGRILAAAAKALTGGAS